MTPVSLVLLLHLAPAALSGAGAAVVTDDFAGHVASIDRSLQRLVTVTERLEQRERIEILLRRAELNMAESSPYVAEAGTTRAAKESADASIRSTESGLREVRQAVESGKLSGKELEDSEMEISHIEESLVNERIQAKRYGDRLSSLESEIAHFGAEREQLKLVIDRLLQAMESPP